VVGTFWRSRNLAAYAACVPTSCRRPGHFLLLAQEKVTKEKGPPDEAPIGLKPDRFAVGWRAFRRGILPRRKVPGVLPGTPAGPDLHPSAASYGDPEDQELRADGSCRCAAHRVAAGGGAHALVAMSQPFP